MKSKDRVPAGYKEGTPDLALIEEQQRELARYKATVACMQLSGGVERTFLDAVTGALAAGPGDELTDKLMQDAAMHFGHENVMDVVRDVLGKLGKAEADREILVEALKEAIQTIKICHGEACWEIYWNNSPEMKKIRTALARVKGEA